MDDVQEKLFARRRLLAEKRQQQAREQQAKRNPERFKRILPPQVLQRLRRGS